MALDGILNTKTLKITTKIHIEKTNKPNQPYN